MLTAASHPKNKPWVNVAIFEDQNAAQALEKFFTDTTLEARTSDDKFFRAALFLRPPHRTFRVLVRENDLAVALGLLESSAPSALQKAIHCPSCGSMTVNYPQMTRHFFLPTVLLHIGILLRVIDHECYCENCHYIWYLPRTDTFAPPRHARHFHLW